MAEAGPKLLKILCIHGYRQNGQMFREKTGSFRKALKKHAELGPTYSAVRPGGSPPHTHLESVQPPYFQVIITAPNVVRQEPSEDGEPLPDQRGWWFSREDDYFRAVEDSDCSKGFEDSLKVIEETIKEQGPFDGIMGFSQGASMVSLVCGLQQQHPEKPFRFNFAILVAGFKSRSSTHSHLYEQPIELPTLHVYGETDKVIPQDMSEALLQHFSNVTTLTHPGGHFVPASAPQKKVYIDFLSKMAGSL